MAGRVLFFFSLVMAAIFVVGSVFAVCGRLMGKPHLTPKKRRSEVCLWQETTKK